MRGLRLILRGLFSVLVGLCFLLAVPLIGVWLFVFKRREEVEDERYQEPAAQITRVTADDDDDQLRGWFRDLPVSERLRRMRRAFNDQEFQPKKKFIPYWERNKAR